MAVVLNQLLFFAFFQCLFLLVIFTISSRKRQRVNLFLWILIITLMVGLIGKVGQISLDWQRQMKGLSELSILFFGPTVYLFVRSTLSEKQYARLDLWHYIPGLIYGSFVLFYYVLPPPEVITERYLSGELLSVVRVLVGSGLIVNSIYFVLAIIEYRKLSKALKDEASYVLNINFVRNFLLAIGACFLIWWSVYLIS
ncbi:MAG: AraC family transcriptional regulator, partial [Bacteroidota bacterium]